MRLKTAALIAVFLSGCSTSPMPSSEASKVPDSRIFAFSAKDQARLVVTRDSGFLAGGCNYELYIDGKLAAEFAAGETAEFGLKPGQHAIGIAGARHCAGAGILESEVTLNPGETVKRRMFTNSAGFHLTPTGF
ncbi:hypothetical protein [Pseudomonas fulva]|uniref:hypothetical protein n=2 Tax=Pseudomonas fulva TaxID=47880 RepID=UPI002B1CFD62|nr:hypothetical protein [Pseudomonas fulva]